MDVETQHLGLAPIKRLVVFGDSNVDTGNLQALSNSDEPLMNSWKGRSSNGPVVTEYLAENLGVELLSFAVGGATTGDENVVSRFFPEFTAAAQTGVMKQIEKFARTDTHFRKSDLVIVWAGSNDIVQVERSNEAELKAKIANAADNLSAAIKALYDLGAQQIVVATRTVRAVYASEDDLNGRDLNKEIKRVVSEFVVPQGLSLRLFDAYSSIEDMVLNPERYGFSKDVSDLCTESKACASEVFEQGLEIANKHINWDYPHKTTRVHQLMGLQLAEQIRSGESLDSAVKKSNAFSTFFGNWTLKNDDWVQDAQGTKVKIANHHTNCRAINTNNSILCVVETPDLAGHILWSLDTETGVVHHLSSFGAARNGVGLGQFDDQGNLALRITFQGEPEGTHRKYLYKWNSDSEYTLTSTQYRGDQPTNNFYGGTFVRLNGGQ